MPVSVTELITYDLDVLHGSACRSAKVAAGVESLINRRIIVATTQEALQITTVVPSLTVDDLQKSIRFYEALGFTISERWEDKGTLQGVMLRGGQDRNRLESGRLEEGPRPAEGCRPAGC